MSLDPVTAGINLITSVVSRVWPDASEVDKQKAALALTEIQAQTDINKLEAVSTKTFVSGWRPMVGWVCGVALAYAAFFEPILRFIARVLCGYTGAFPSIDTNITLQILLGLLGLGGMRSFEKIKGVTK